MAILLSSLMNLMNPNDLSDCNHHAIIVSMGFNKKNITGKPLDQNGWIIQLTLIH